MADKKWLGQSLAKKDVWTFTVGGTIATNDTFTIVVNNKKVTFTATATTTANVVAGLLALVQDTTNAPPEILEYDWESNGTTTLTATAGTAGVPGTFTVEKSSAAGTFATSNTVAATGPNFYGQALNWSGGSLPANGDRVFISGQVSILYELDALDNVELAYFEIGANYQGRQPLIQNTGGYLEYRLTHLVVDADVVKIGMGEGRGPSGIKLKVINDGAIVEVLKTQQSGSTEEPAVMLTVDTNGVVEVRDGEVGISIQGGDVSDITTYSQSGGSVVAGEGASIDSVLVTEGTTILYGPVGDATVKEGATLTTHTEDLIDSVAVDEQGTWNHLGGDVDEVSLSGVCDLSLDNTERTFGLVTLYAGANLNDPNRTLTITELDYDAPILQAS